jgi:GntR family transcriptional regulator
VKVHLHPESGLPTYLQIAAQIKEAIAVGGLRLNDQLPSVRNLAFELGINPNTVARAYRELEHDGILRTMTGSGTFVQVQAPGLLREEKLRRLRPFATQLAVEAAHLRLTRDDVNSLLNEVMKDLLKHFGKDL